MIGDDYSFPYTSLAGFVAEFCSVGGEVTKRVWPPLGEKDYSSFISQIPEDVDGLYVGIGGSGLISFLKQYEQQRGKIDPKKVMGNVFCDDPLVLKEVGDSLTGAVTAGPTAADSTEPAAKEYVGEVEAAFPEIAPLAASVFVYNYYIAMEGLLTALENVDGNISGGQKELQAALDERRARRGLRPDRAGRQPQRNRRQLRQAHRAGRQRRRHSGRARRSARSRRSTRRSAGHSVPRRLAPDRENPTCEKGSEPTWVGNAEEVDFGG